MRKHIFSPMMFLGGKNPIFVFAQVLGGICASEDQEVRTFSDEVTAEQRRRLRTMQNMQMPLANKAAMRDTSCQKRTRWQILSRGEIYPLYIF